MACVSTKRHQRRPASMILAGRWSRRWRQARPQAVWRQRGAVVLVNGGEREGNALSCSVKSVKSVKSVS